MTTDELSTPRPAVTNVPDWVVEHYRQVDAGDVDAYTQDFDPDVELRFASRPPIVGRAAVRDALAAGARRARRMAHTFVGCFEAGDTTILEFDVALHLPGRPQPPRAVGRAPASRAERAPRQPARVRRAPALSSAVGEAHRCGVAVSIITGGGPGPHRFANAGSSMLQRPGT